MRDDEIHRVLSSLELFRTMRSSELRHLIGAAHTDDWDHGDAVVREGVQAHAFYVIVEGHARVDVSGRPVRTLGPGEYFGEISLLDRGARTASVTADGPLRTLGISRVSFESLLAANPDLAQRVEDNARVLLNEDADRPQ